MTSSDEKSASATPGTSWMNCNTAGTTKAWVTPHVESRRTSSPKSISLRISKRAPMKWATVAQPLPPMWNKGIATSTTESSVIFHSSPPTGSSPIRLSLESITPLGRPVVPLEYSWRATSSDCDGVCGSSSAWPRTHAS